MAFSGPGGGKRLITEINVTPFVDIVLVLLIIFLVTATTIIRGSIGLTLPKAGTASDMPAALLVLGVDASGRYLIRGKAATDLEVENFVKAEVAKNPEIEAVIAGDRQVPYGRVMELIDKVQSLGVKKFAAEVERAVGN